MLSLKPITAVLMLACLLAGAGSYAQQHISFSGKNVPLTTIFSAIENQTDYVFFNDQSLLQKAKKVTIKVKKASLGEVLELCFKDQPFSYRVIGKTITLRRLGSSTPEPRGPPMPVTITGMVTNESGEPVPGATIMTADGNVQTVAGDDGRFMLKDADAHDSIVITSINYEPREIKPDAQHTVVVQLKRRISELGAVVSTGYQKTYKDRQTGSVVSIDNALFNRRVSVNVLDRLEGVTSGLLFNKNIVSGVNQSSMSIRGRSTIFANPEPLVILDNFPYTGDVSNINPNDIETVSVLKDAAASAIWGAFSGNGVIVLTSKKGKYNQPARVSFNSNITITGRPNLRYTPQMGSSDYINVEQFLFNHSFYDNTEVNPLHPTLSPVVELLFKEKNGSLSSTQADAMIDLYRGQDKRDDLEKYFYRNSVNQQYALNVSGGRSHDLYYFSAGYDKDLAGLVGNSYNRITLTGNNTLALLSKRLEINTGIIFSASKTITNNAFSLSAIYPYLKLAGANGMALSVPADLRQSYKDTAGHGALLDWNYRPLDELHLSDNITHLNDYRFNIGLKYIVLSGLDFTGSYQYNIGSTGQRNFMGQQTYYTRNLINDFTQVNGASITRPVPLGGIMDKSTNDYHASNIRGQLNYSHEWDNNHTLTALGGAEIRTINAYLSKRRLYGYDETANTSAAVDYLSTFPMYYASIASGKIPYLDFDRATTDHYISYYFNAAYTLRQRYIFSASARKDESNIFGVKTNQKGVPLWSLGASWNISKERFYPAGSWLPYLRLRLTDGYNGNVDKSVSAYTTMLVNGQNVYGAINGGIINPPNPALQWEKDNTINLGLDFGIKRNIISGSIEYFRRKGNNLLGYSPLDPTTGNSTFKGNTADMSGRGIDIVINTKNINRQFKWYTAFLFSNATDKVTSYKQLQASIAAYCGTNTINPLPGRPLYSVYALKWEGLDPQTGDPQGLLNGAVSKDYSSILNSPDFNNLVYKGAANPTYFGSLRNTFSWKQLELSFNITWKLGYYFKRNTISYTDVFNGLVVGHPDFDKRWQKPGDERTTTVPSMVYSLDISRDNFYKFSEIMVEKGDHVRLQDIQLSYNLKETQARKLHLRLLQFYVYANNIGLLWKANNKGIDPDYISGIPNPRSIAAGIKADF